MQFVRQSILKSIDSQIDCLFCPQKNRQIDCLDTLSVSVSVSLLLPAPQPCTTTYDGCGGASMLSVIREGLEEAIEEEEMDWEMKNSPAVTNTEQLLDAGRAFANFQKFKIEWDCEFPA